MTATTRLSALTAAAALDALARIAPSAAETREFKMTAATLRAYADSTHEGVDGAAYRVQLQSDESHYRSEGRACPRAKAAAQILATARMNAARPDIVFINADSSLSRVRGFARIVRMWKTATDRLLSNNCALSESFDLA